MGNLTSIQPEFPPCKTLQEHRQRRGLSIASLAHELMVSETQLRSLETGESRGFYNAKHRAQIAEKYALVLGLDWKLIEHSADGDRSRDARGLTPSVGRGQSRLLQAQPNTSTVSVKAPSVFSSPEVALNDGVGLTATRLRAKTKQGRMEYLIAGGVLGMLAIWFSVDAWQHKRAEQASSPLSVVEQRFDDPPSAINARPVELAKGGRLDVALAKPSELDYPQPFVSKPGESQSANPVARDREKSQRRDEASNKRVGDKPGLEERSRSAAKELRYPDRKALADAGNYLGAANNRQDQSNAPGPGLMAVAPASGPESRSLDLCEVSDRMASVVVPVSRLKNTPYVHVASGVSQKVCVRSADGRVERLTLSANEARSIFGKAPFTVVSEQPSSVEIFYLGARVRHNGESRVLKIVDPDPMS